MRAKFLFVFSCSLFLLSCFENNLGKFTVSSHDKYNFETFHDKLHTLPYVNEGGIIVWSEGFHHVRLGSSINEFQDALGHPDVYETTTTIMEGSTSTISTLMYFHKKYGPALVEDHEGDVYYSAFFNDKGLFVLISNDKSNIKYDLGSFSQSDGDWHSTYGLRSYEKKFEE